MNHNVDVYAIQNDKEKLSEALTRVNKESLSNTLYLNCTCHFTIGGAIINSRIFDACFYSEDSDCVVFFAKGKMTHEEIQEYLINENVKFTTVNFYREDDEDFVDMDALKEVHFVSNKEELVNAIDDSISKDITLARLYPGEISRLSIGYKASRDYTRYYELDARFCKGTIVFKDKIILLVNQYQSKNISSEDAYRILSEKVSVIVNNDRKSVKRR